MERVGFGYGTGLAATQDSRPPQETITPSPEQVPRGPDPSPSRKGVRTCTTVRQLNTDLAVATRVEVRAGVRKGKARESKCEIKFDTKTELGVNLSFAT